MVRTIPPPSPLVECLTQSWCIHYFCPKLFKCAMRIARTALAGGDNKSSHDMLMNSDLRLANRCPSYKIVPPSQQVLRLWHSSTSLQLRCTKTDARSRLTSTVTDQLRKCLARCIFFVCVCVYRLLLTVSCHSPPAQQHCARHSQTFHHTTAY
jgi:hypothetical protein